MRVNVLFRNGFGIDRLLNENNFFTMITQYEVPGYLREQIPSLSSNPLPGRASLEIYAYMNSFSDYTRHAVQEHDLSMAGKCFALAEKLYKEGDNLVKLLIENSFLYSITSYMPMELSEKNKVKAIIPVKLYDVYIKQVTHNGY